MDIDDFLEIDMEKKIIKFTGGEEPLFSFDEILKWIMEQDWPDDENPLGSNLTTEE